MRLRIRFAKTDAMRFTGHLDLHRAWERTFRRAGLPLAYTQGFSPHPRLNLASALPLGFTGEAEILDAWLETMISCPEILSRLQASTPPGIRIHSVEEIEDRLPSLQSELKANEYLVQFLEPISNLEDRAANLMNSISLPRERRGKTYDLRPLILKLTVLASSDPGYPRLAANLTACEGATGRPEEVLDALGILPETTRIHRTRLVFRDL